MTSVNQRHPLYEKFEPVWEQMRDSYSGQRAVKQKNFLYLPPTQSMYLDGVESDNSPGYKAYQAYKLRAEFPDVFKQAVESAIGVMHNKPPIIEVPAALEPIIERATLRNESLECLLRRINEQQLICGRVGLMVDLPLNTRQNAPDAGALVTSQGTTERSVPYIALYECEKMINWDAGYRDGVNQETLNLMVLDESEYERQSDFSWDYVQKYRVLVLSSNEEIESGRNEDFVNVTEGTYQVGVFREQNESFVRSSLITPMFRGASLEMIPFTMISSKDITFEPEEPPLLGLSEMAMSAYRQSADYEQSLHMQGQDTLVIIGGNDDGEAVRIGAGSMISVPLQGDAKFIGVDSAGLEEQRIAHENKLSAGSSRAGQLLDTVSRERESGEALTIRVAARTASLKQVALAGAFGLQDALRKAAVWVGAKPEEVTVLPNLDFVDEQFDVESLVKMIMAKNSGAPISNETIHAYMVERDVTAFDYEEELDKIQNEEALGVGANMIDVDDNVEPNDVDETEET